MNSDLEPPPKCPMIVTEIEASCSSQVVDSTSFNSDNTNKNPLVLEPLLPSHSPVKQEQTQEQYKDELAFTGASEVASSESSSSLNSTPTPTSSSSTPQLNNSKPHKTTKKAPGLSTRKPAIPKRTHDAPDIFDLFLALHNEETGKYEREKLRQIVRFKPPPTSKNSITNSQASTPSSQTPNGTINASDSQLSEKSIRLISSLNKISNSTNISVKESVAQILSSKNLQHEAQSNEKTQIQPIKDEKNDLDKSLSMSTEFSSDPVSFQDNSAPKIDEVESTIVKSEPSMENQEKIENGTDYDSDEEIPEDQLMASFKQDIALLHHTFRYAKRIVIITGAGISVAAGIPDFRSTTGLFRLLRNDLKLKGNGANSGQQLFDASVVFSDDTALKNFHSTMCDLHSLCFSCKPTKFHLLMNQISKENRLLRLYTQNIDCLDTSLPDLYTARPLTRPWPKAIQLHGTIGSMNCTKCHWTSPFDPSKFRYTTYNKSDEDSTHNSNEKSAHSRNSPNSQDHNGNEDDTDEDEDGYNSDLETVIEHYPVPDCPECLESDSIRTIAGKRSQGVGKLRPSIVLYNEPNPDSEAIGQVTEHDVTGKPDGLIVVGTSLKIPGVRRMVREMSQAVHAAKGCSIWMNIDDPSALSSREFESCFDLIVKGDCQLIPDILNDYEEEKRLYEEDKARERQLRMEAKILRQQLALERKAQKLLAKESKTNTKANTPSNSVSQDNSGATTPTADSTLTEKKKRTKKATADSTKKSSKTTPRSTLSKTISVKSEANETNTELKKTEGNSKTKTSEKPKTGTQKPKSEKSKISITEGGEIKPSSAKPKKAQKESSTAKKPRETASKMTKLKADNSVIKREKTSSKNKKVTKALSATVAPKNSKSKTPSIKKETNISTETSVKISEDLPNLEMHRTDSSSHLSLKDILNPELESEFQSSEVKGFKERHNSSGPPSPQKKRRRVSSEFDQKTKDNQVKIEPKHISPDNYLPVIHPPDNFNSIHSKDPNVEVNQSQGSLNSMTSTFESSQETTISTYSCNSDSILNHLHHHNTFKEASLVIQNSQSGGLSSSSTIDEKNASEALMSLSNMFCENNTQPSVQTQEHITF